jgi:hypothetical protein
MLTGLEEGKAKDDGSEVLDAGEVSNSFNALSLVLLPSRTLQMVTFLEIRAVRAVWMGAEAGKK